MSSGRSSSLLGIAEGADLELDEDQLGKRERNKLDKRQRIVAAATELFTEKGFEDTTTAEIAARADIGAGTLYLYVESKEELLVSVFVEVAGHAWADAFDSVDPSATLHDQVVALFTHVTEHHYADLRLSRAFFKELPFVSQEVRSGSIEFNTWFSARLEGLLQEAAAAGKLDAEVPRAALAHNLYALWQLQMRRLTTESTTQSEMLTLLEQNVRTGLWRMTPET